MFSKKTIAGRWEQHLKIATNDVINEAKKSYQGSSEEECDIAREFTIGNGSLTHLLNHIPFMRLEDEHRVINIVKKLIDAGKISNLIKIKKIPIRK